jgi:hypothetical protein
MEIEQDSKQKILINLRNLKNAFVLGKTAIGYQNLAIGPASIIRLTVPINTTYAILSLDISIATTIPTTESAWARYTLDGTTIATGSDYTQEGVPFGKFDKITIYGHTNLDNFRLRTVNGSGAGVRLKVTYYN